MTASASTEVVIDTDGVIHGLEATQAPLTPEEDAFALAVVESRGNVAAAYKAVFGAETTYALARGREYLGRPHVQNRVAALQNAVQEVALINVASHLMELADIRDLAKYSGQLKTALAAERARGEVVGLYTNMEAEKNKSPQVVIQMVNRFDAAI